MKPPMSAGNRALAAAAWLLVVCVPLNLALTFHNLWPTVLVRPVNELSLDLCVGLLLLALYHETRRRTPGAALQALLGIVLLLLIVGRYIQVTAPALFGRELNLYWDARHLPAVTMMWVEAQQAWRSAAAALAICVTLALLCWLLAAALRRINGALREAAPRRAVLLVCTLGLALYLAGRVSDRLASEHWFALSVAGMYGEQLRFIYRATLAPPALPPPPPAPPPAVETAGYLRGADLQLIFLESYGAAVTERGGFAAALAPAFAALNQAAVTGGWQTASAWLNSPTFGGASWLAHASVLSGSWIASQDDYRLLLASRRASLISAFTAAGYRTVALLPGLKQPWPEGSFYAFDQLYPAAAIDYPGPAFGWWDIPDQYSLDWLSRRELTPPGRPPLLVFYASVMSHSPFFPTPPYLPDWSRLATPRPYDKTQLAAARALAETGDSDQHYLQALSYNLFTVAGYLAQRAPPDGLLVVLGDHQPPAFVSGPGASWRVPVHVFSRHSDHLQGFFETGFRPGLNPQPPSLGGLQRLYPLLLTGGPAQDQLVGR